MSKQVTIKELVRDISGGLSEEITPNTLNKSIKIFAPSHSSAKKKTKKTDDSEKSK